MAKEPAAVPNCLRLCRRKCGLSQKEIAYLMGYRSATAVSSYERGTKLPQLTNLLKLEIIYRTPVAFLFRPHYEVLRDEIRQKEQRLGSRKGS